MDAYISWETAARADKFDIEIDSNVQPVSLIGELGHGFNNRYLIGFLSSSDCNYSL